MSVCEPTILNPIAQNFSCNNCGNCCTRAWKVKVDPEKVSPVERSRIFQSLQSEGFVPLPVIAGETRVGRRGNGACGFRQDGGCAIHAELGPFAKPVVCQLYPFSAVNTPDGYYLSLSFSCPTVLENSGQEVSSQIPDLKRALGESSFFSNPAMSADTRVPLYGQESLPWVEYLALEDELWKVVTGENPMKELLQAATMVLHQGRFEMETFSAIASDFSFFTAYGIAALEHPKDGDKREKMCLALQAEEQPYSGLLESKLPVFLPSKPGHEVTRRLFHRYMENQIRGKQLISEGTLLSRVLMLAVSCTIALYYLRARTEEKEPTKEDLAWVFHLVETAISGHSNVFHDLFRQYEAAVLRELARA
ncbi:MAG TPA: YkgJ family cysteine cluster protein [Phycisphaerales bacterium]|nr:YkgJ family cysteine cluster protein [Phycisphaerales bacterium]